VHGPALVMLLECLRGARSCIDHAVRVHASLPQCCQCRGQDWLNTHDRL